MGGGPLSLARAVGRSRTESQRAKSWPGSCFSHNSMDASGCRISSRGAEWLEPQATQHLWRQFLYWLESHMMKVSFYEKTPPILNDLEARPAELVHSRCHSVDEMIWQSAVIDRK